MNLDRNQLLLSLASAICPACGKTKRAKQTLCQPCFHRLPGAERARLYDGLGAGYERAVAIALEMLGARQLILPKPTCIHGGDGPEQVVMFFGKYKGRTLGDIVAEDPGYIDFMVDRVETPSLRVAMKAIHTKYSAEIEKAIEQREFRGNVR